MILEKQYILFINILLESCRYSSGVERFLGKEEVTSSNLVIGSNLFFYQNIAYKKAVIITTLNAPILNVLLVANNFFVRLMPFESSLLPSR